ncbi:MAG: hypothetical protein QM532_04440 [Cyanobium sp. MAG06]|nr:hypothetical protein [Cyanobium sp. MAG06]
MKSRETILNDYQNEPELQARVANIYDKVYKTFERFGFTLRKNINMDNVMVSVMATIRVESGRPFLGVKELGGETQRYAPYFGRGYIQLTWDYNYKLFSQLIFRDDRMFENPDLALNEETSIEIVVLYFIMANLLGFATMEDDEAVRRGVNGGLNGFADFENILAQYRK